MPKSIPSNHNSRNIFAVIVTHNPDYTHLNNLIHAVSAQVDRLLVFDNGSADFDITGLRTIPPNVSVEANGYNIGLASAYNFAIKKAQNYFASHIVLFDQDSLPASDMVQTLLAELKRYNHKDMIAAAAGPMYRDIKGIRTSPFVKIAGAKLVRVPCEAHSTVEIDHLISSGCLIDIRAFEKIGVFSDELFIDYVDTEWCLRARIAGFKLLGVGAASMQHSIGDATATVFGKTVTLHSPLRLYYQFRNMIWTLKRPYLNWQWRVLDTIRLAKLLLLFTLFLPGRRERLPFIFRGIYHGLIGRMGKLTQ